MLLACTVYSPRTRHCADLTVLGRIKQAHHLVFADLHIRLKVDHPAIHCRRQFPYFTVNTAANFLVEVDAIGGNNYRKDNPNLTSSHSQLRLRRGLLPLPFPFFGIGRSSS